MLQLFSQHHLPVHTPVIDLSKIHAQQKGVTLLITAFNFKGLSKVPPKENPMAVRPLIINKDIVAHSFLSIHFYFVFSCNAIAT